MCLGRDSGLSRPKLCALARSEGGSTFAAHPTQRPAAASQNTTCLEAQSGLDRSLQTNTFHRHTDKNRVPVRVRVIVAMYAGGFNRCVKKSSIPQVRLGIWVTNSIAASTKVKWV